MDPKERDRLMAQAEEWFCYGNATVEEIASGLNQPVSQIQKWRTRRGWTQKRREAQSALHTQAQQLHTVTDKLLTKLLKLLDNEEGASIQDIHKNLSALQITQGLIDRLQRRYTLDRGQIIGIALDDLLNLLKVRNPQLAKDMAEYVEEYMVQQLNRPRESTRA